MSQPRCAMLKRLRRCSGVIGLSSASHDDSLPLRKHLDRVLALMKWEGRFSLAAYSQTTPSPSASRMCG